jgi:hypothetical protein
VGISCHGIGPSTPTQLWPHGDSNSGVLSVPSLQVETVPGVDSVTPYAMLKEVCLVFAPGILLLPPPVPSAGGSDPRVEILCG